MINEKATANRVDREGDGNLTFSELADRELWKLGNRYLEELQRQAVRVADREGVDNVSKTHVEKANRYLFNPPSAPLAWPTWVSPSGGVLAGAGLGDWIAQSHTSNPSFTNLAAATAFLVVGAIAIVVAGVVSIKGQ